MSDNRPPVVVTNPSVTTVASDVTSALKTSPLLLVMVLLNCVFIAAGAYFLRMQQENAFKLIDKIFDKCLPERLHSTSFTGIYLPSSIDKLTEPKE